MSRKVFVVAFTLAAARLAAFLVTFLNQSRDAQWQLSYCPLWVADFPISLTYFVLPIHWAEGILGPIWWFCLPVGVARLFRRRSKQP